ncbi:predicted protein [Coccidioides posadasii str. Silveira]|uniref:Predicted protein n=1 Tax=Coccidioides posadasii (strain RMSCC 757 / Silveira) TaxID=443226 RepID=E9DJF6_COCPS|nr:predicted protein [Coccidioides posadasii str. Silveira]
MGAEFKETCNRAEKRFPISGFPSMYEVLSMGVSLFVLEARHLGCAANWLHFMWM